MTPEQQARLQALRQKHAEQVPTTSSLPPEKQARLEALRAKHGQETTAQPQPEAPFTPRFPRETPELRASMDQMGYNEEGTKRALQTAGVGMAGPAMANEVVKRGAGMLSRAGLSGLLGVASEQARTPGDALGSFLTGAASQIVPEAASKVLRKAGDIGMQAAVGRTKYTPGVGETLADEGIMGTKSQMTQKVKDRLGDAGTRLRESAARVPEGAISAPKIASEIWEQQSRPFTQNISKPSLAGRKELAQIGEYINDIKSRGNLSGPEAAGYSQSAGRVAYGLRDKAGETTAKQLAKLEQIKFSDAIKKADPTGQYADAASKYAALKKAEAGLEKEETLRKSALGLLSTPVDALPFGNLVGSVGSKGAIEAGKKVESLPQILRLFQTAVE